MKKINKLLLGVFLGMGISILMVTLMAAAPSPSAAGNITYVTSRDGMKIYQYNGYVIVKTNNAVSITR